MEHRDREVFFFHRLDLTMERATSSPSIAHVLPTHIQVTVLKLFDKVSEIFDRSAESLHDKRS